MSILKYKLGQFSEDNSISEPENDLEWDDLIEFYGFRGMGKRYGTDISGEMLVYESKDRSDRCLAAVSWNGNEIQFVVIDDFPSLMMFLRDFAPMFMLEKIAYDLDKLKYHAGIEK